MNEKERNIIKEIKAYLKERPKLSIAAQYAYSMFMCVLSAFMVGLSFRLFVAPLNFLKDKYILLQEE